MFGKGTGKQNKKWSLCSRDSREHVLCGSKCQTRSECNCIQGGKGDARSLLSGISEKCWPLGLMFFHLPGGDGPFLFRIPCWHWDLIDSVLLIQAPPKPHPWSGNTFFLLAIKCMIPAGFLSVLINVNNYYKNNKCQPHLL